MALKFNEDTRVKIPATVQFLRLGYDYQSLKNADIDRDTRIFTDRFRKSLEKINGRSFSEAEIMAIVSEIHTVLKYEDMGKTFYNWLTHPHAGQIKLIDWENIENNDFAVVDELVFGPQNAGSFRPDITVLINGMPLAFLEVKKPNNEGGIQAEFKRMLDVRLEVEAYKKYFNMLQIVSFSNNMEYEDDDDSIDPQEVKAGSFYTTPNGFNTSFSFFRDELPRKNGFEDISEGKIKWILKDNHYSPDNFNTPEFQTNLDPYSPTNRFVTSLFDKERLFYLLYHGISYLDGDQGKKQKHIMRYPQFFASKATLERIRSGGKSGIIFHTQGSGKTGLAYFLTGILKKHFAEKNMTARFYYVVDRLDLLNQASGDMKKRGLTVKNVESKKGFEEDLNQVIAREASDSTGAITVVNIQKFDSDMPVAQNEYNAKVQRIFFIDEAHRSYSRNGEYFKNLMTVDRDAIFIALTGTPLLSKKERSSLKFGDYIHKYFYNKSIADGYTLPIKKETIETTERAEIRNNLDLENPDRDKTVVTESEDYINALGKFIEKDFNNFRLTNNDSTIGAMIVCNSNPQAMKVKRWFDEHSRFKTGLVINDMPTAQNRATQIAFKEEYEPDILIVHRMLTTGYDVPRLKKMYLLRNAKEHTLLQTISRVNRPYRSPNGNFYKFGYITDFVDIEEEYDRTIEMYLREMADGMEEEGVTGGLAGLVVSPEDIWNRYLKTKKELDGMVDSSNLEIFQKQITAKNKDELLTIRRLLNSIRTARNEFILSNSQEYADQIDQDKIKDLLKLVQGRIDLKNLKATPTDMLSIISNKEVVEIIYEFIKTKIVLFDLGKLNDVFERLTGEPAVQEIVETIKNIQHEIKNNRNPEQSEVIQLDEYLQELFEKLEISNIEDLYELNGEFRKAYDVIKGINEENERISRRYDGNYAFVKTLSDAREQLSEINREDIAAVLDGIYNHAKGIEDESLLVIQGRNAFKGAVKKATMVSLMKSGTYKRLNLKDWYDDLIDSAYTNMRRF